MREKEIIPSELKQGKAENHVGLKVLREKECMGGEETSLSRERLRKVKRNRKQCLNRNLIKLDRLRCVQEVSRCKCVS